VSLGGVGRLVVKCTERGRRSFWATRVESRVSRLKVTAEGPESTDAWNGSFRRGRAWVQVSEGGASPFASGSDSSISIPSFSFKDKLKLLSRLKTRLRVFSSSCSPFHLRMCPWLEENAASLTPLEAQTRWYENGCGSILLIVVGYSVGLLPHAPTDTVNSILVESCPVKRPVKALAAPLSTRQWRFYSALSWRFYRNQRGGHTGTNDARMDTPTGPSSYVHLLSSLSVTTWSFGDLPGAE
jgi:hypothetical protein